MTTTAPTLTDQQARILEAISHGTPQSEIAERMFVGPSTVSRDLAAARSRLGARDNAHAVALAFRAGILPTDGEATA